MKNLKNALFLLGIISGVWNSDSLFSQSCTLNCPGDITVNNAPGQCVNTVNYSIGLGDCNAFSIEPNLPSGSFFPVGLTTITAASNEGSTCSFNITVIDIEPPSFEPCPGNMVVTLGPGACSAFVNYTVAAIDNCSSILFQTEGLPPGSEFPIGVTNNCFTAIDDSGNTASCCFMIIINEFPNPTQTLACNDNVQITLGPNGCAVVGADQILEGGPYGCYDNYLVEILDENGVPIGNEVCCGDVGETKVVRVTDPGSGSHCFGSITVKDKLNPEMQCQDITLIIPVGSVYYLTPGEVDNGSYDNCGLTNLYLSQEEFTCADAGQHAITLTAADFSGNTDACEANITVFTDDTEHPSVNCPSNIIVNLNPGLCSAFVNYNVTATDNCPGNLVVSQTEGLPSGSDFPIGTTNNCFLVMDDSGNPGSCCFTVTVLEFPNPTQNLACNDNVQISLGPNGCTVVVADQILEGGAYGCYEDYQVEVLNEHGFSIGNEVCCGDVGETKVVRVTNPFSGNQCWGSILISDGLEPVLVCQDMIVQIGPVGNCTGPAPETPSELVPPSDNCGLGSLEFTDLEEDISCLGYIITREWTATDLSGNQSSCIQIITLIDYDGPEVECPVNPITIKVFNANYNQSGPNGYCTGDLEIPPLTIVGDCTGEDPNSYVTELWTLGQGVLLQSINGNGGLFSNVEWQSANPPSNDAVYTVRRLFYDICGYGTECVHDIIVSDGVPPTPICHSIVNLVIPQGEECATLLPGDLDNGSFDNCSDVYFYMSKTQPFLQPPYFYSYTPQLEFCMDETGANMVNLLVLDFNPESVPGATLPDGSIFLFPGNPIFEGSFNLCMVTVIVLEESPPPNNDFCDQLTTIGLTSQGNSGEGCSWLPAQALDNTDVPNGGYDYFFAAKEIPDLDPPYFYQYYPQLEFCCDDDENNSVVVLALNFDPYTIPGATQGDGSFILNPGDPIFEGNFINCISQVVVNDKLPPVLLSCPQNRTIDCDEYLQNYADGIATSNYSVLDIFGSPTFYDNCPLTVTPEVAASIDVCNRGSITRSWQASDGSNAPAVCTQTITVTHLNNWEVLFPADITATCVNGQLPDFGEPQIFFDECELIGESYSDQLFSVPDACYKIVRTWTVINWCIYNPAGNNTTTDDILVSPRRYRSGPDGWVQYQQVIKVVDNEAPLFTIPAIDGCIVSTGCTKTLNLPYPVITDQCSPTYIVNITGAFGTFNNIGQGGANVPNVGLGTYKVTYAVSDNCGNTRYETVVIEVEDCKKPTPICKNGLVAEIMQTGEIEVFASQLDNGSFDNCGPVVFSFSPDLNNTSIVFTVADLGSNLVDVWVTDIYGNQDFCQVIIYVVEGDNITINDPCTCLNNASASGNGQFSETVEVIGEPGETWSVSIAIGFYAMASPNPPAPPLPITAGLLLTEVLPGIFHLSGKHIDAFGYYIAVTNGSKLLSISNVCYYPKPVFHGLQELYCSNEGAQSVVVTAELGDGSGQAAYDDVLFELLFQGLVIDSQSGAGNMYDFNPGLLNSGHYTLRASFDAADDGPGHPGCIQPIEANFQVRQVGCGVFPWSGH